MCKCGGKVNVVKIWRYKYNIQIYWITWISTQLQCIVNKTFIRDWPNHKRISSINSSQAGPGTSAMPGRSETVTGFRQVTIHFIFKFVCFFLLTMFVWCLNGGFPTEILPQTCQFVWVLRCDWSFLLSIENSHVYSQDNFHNWNISDNQRQGTINFIACRYSLKNQTQANIFFSFSLIWLFSANTTVLRKQKSKVSWQKSNSSFWQTIDILQSSVRSLVVSSAEPSSSTLVSFVCLTFSSNRTCPGAAKASRTSPSSSRASFKSSISTSPILTSSTSTFSFMLMSSTSFLMSSSTLISSSNK